MKKNIIITILVVIVFLFSIVATIISIQNYDSNIITKKIKDGYLPANSVFVRITSSIKEYIDGIIHLNQIKKENEQLKEQLYRLESDKVTIEEIKSENQKLKELLDLKNEIFSNADVETARVVLRSPQSWFSYLTIDKGLDNGIKPNMVVINNQGLIGVVVDAGKNWAKVETLLDSDFSASALVVRTRDIGVVKGNVELTDKRLCELKYISKDSKISVGDVVITSGMGVIFPKGIVIGKITKIDNDKFELTKDILITPAVDFDNLEYVMVIKRLKNINLSVGVK